MYVVHDRGGQAIEESAFDSAWKRLIKKASKEGVEHFTFHDLKAQGESDAKDKRLSGHKTPRMQALYNRKIDEVEPAG